MKGHFTPHTAETKQKIKDALKMRFPNGRTAWNKGKSHSPETRAKISVAQVGKRATPNQLEGLKHGHGWNRGLTPSPITREKLRQFNLGKQHSEETKRLLSSLFSQEKNPHWRGGTTALKKVIRRGFLYRQWRSDVFTRDNFTCVLCRQRGGYLNADHYPKMFSQIIEEYSIKSVQDSERCAELWNINNGRTLCVPCHRQVSAEQMLNNKNRYRNT